MKATSKRAASSRGSERRAALDQSFASTGRGDGYHGTRKSASVSRNTPQPKRDSARATNAAKADRAMPQSMRATAQPKRGTVRPAPKASSARVQMPSFSEAEERAQSAAAYDAEHQQSAERNGSAEGEKGKKSLSHKLRAAKAERQFNKRFAGDDAAKAAPQESSRPALYQMKMGKTHKRSSRMQNTSPKKKGGLFSRLFGALSILDPRSQRFSSRALITCATLVLAVVLLYQPVANYYQEVRQHQQLEAEYEVVSEYYSNLKSEVDYLNTKEGLEEYVREELGWVKAGEKVVNVEGLDPRDASAQKGSITADISNAVPTPTTWYSGVLDVVFGYNKL